MRIGPYAELAVAHTARATADLNDLCAKVALEIPDEGSRTEFLQAVQVGKTSTYGPGFQFAARRDAAGTLVSDCWLRPRQELLVLAVPPELTRDLNLIAG